MALVEMYTNPFCGYCARAKRLLDQKSVPVVEIDVIADGAKRAEMVKRSGGETTPQILIDGRAIGGCDDLYALDRAGKLDALLGLPA